MDRSFNVSQRPGWWTRPESRRVAILRFYDNLFRDLFRPGLTYRVDRPWLPEDANLVGVEYEYITRAWSVYIESETFDVVPESQMPPIIESPSITVSVIEPEAGPA